MKTRGMGRLLAMLTGIGFLCFLAATETLPVFPGVFVRLHFTQIDLAPGDQLEIQDPNGRIVQSYSDSSKQNVLYHVPVLAFLR